MKNRIMMVTIEEINENGIKFTMADLARRLAVSKSTIYTYFSSKEELIGTIVDYVLENMRQNDETIMNDQQLDFHAKLKALFLNESELISLISNRFIMDLKRYMPKEWEKSEECRKHKWQMLESLLKEGIDKGIIRSIDLTVAKVMFNAAIGEFLSQNFLMQNNLTVTDAISKMADILYYGMVNDPNCEHK